MEAGTVRLIAGAKEIRSCSRNHEVNPNEKPLPCRVLRRDDAWKFLRELLFQHAPFPQFLPPPPIPEKKKSFNRPHLRELLTFAAKKEEETCFE